MDHTDYIRIKGLTDSANEVFQGIATGSAASTTATTAEATDMGNMPQEVLEIVAQYSTDLADWLKKAAAYEPTETQDRGLPAVIGAAPALPSLIGPAALAAFATGGLSLPVTAAIVGGQLIMNAAATSVSNYAASLDQNSPQSLFKKAFLYRESGQEYSIFEKALLFLNDKNKQTSVLKQALLFQPIDSTAWESILKTGLLELVTNEQEKQEWRSILVNLLNALDSLDVETDFGPFRTLLRSKIIRE